MAKDSLTHVAAEPGGREIVITRVFNTPREHVFKAITDPNLMPQRWDPKKYTTTVDEMDVRPGGVWRFVQHRPEGGFAFRGVYHPIVPPERVVQTVEFEVIPSYVSLETSTFEEHDGKTKLKETSVLQTVEDRDGILQPGKEEGMLGLYVFIREASCTPTL